MEIIDRFSELFTYREDGRLINRTTRCKRNSKEGSLVGKESPVKTYRQVWVDGVNYRQHVVIWAMFNGCMPDVIDHIDHDFLNNRIENLRSVTHKDNIRHGSGRQAGVWLAPNGRYHAAIYVDCIKRHLGCFATKQEALDTRLKAEEELWVLV